MGFKFNPAKLGTRCPCKWWKVPAVVPPPRRHLLPPPRFQPRLLLSGGTSERPLAVERGCKASSISVSLPDSRGAPKLGGAAACPRDPTRPRGPGSARRGDHGQGGLFLMPAFACHAREAFQAKDTSWENQGVSGAPGFRVGPGSYTSSCREAETQTGPQTEGQNSFRGGGGGEPFCVKEAHLRAGSRFWNVWAPSKALANILRPCLSAKPRSQPGSDFSRFWKGT